MILIPYLLLFIHSVPAEITGMPSDDLRVGADHYAEQEDSFYKMKPGR